MTPPMARVLELEVLPQPDETTCGATCLHGIYGYYGDAIPLPDVVRQVTHLEEGGTLAVFLGCHALRRGYRAALYSYNLQVFDPTWFREEDVDLAAKLRAQADAKPARRKLQIATRAYLEFLELGGKLLFEDLTRKLLRRHLNAGVPILAGVSATYLYACAREYGPRAEPDDVRGEPSGHFVVVAGYDRERRTVYVADPLRSNPFSPSGRYEVHIDRLIGAVLLGNLTYDANLLVIEPRKDAKAARHVDPDRRQ